MSTRAPIPVCTAVSGLRGSEAESIDACYLVGDGAAMRRVRSQLQRIAPYFRVALITGEAGTGKETVARALHLRSSRAAGPFEVWRPADFAEKLRDENLSADGLRELRRGTLYIDCIGAMPLSLQDRLLHLLDEQEALRSQRAELRIIASNERELRTLITTGQLREELYRRIGAVEIGLAPLRRRPEDIACVAETLMRHLPNGAPITPAAMALLTAYEWPGNVRELRRVLQTAAGLAEGGAIEPVHLAAMKREPEAVQPAERTLERLQDVIQRHVLEVLTRCAGNKLRASEVLGISRSTLYRMLDSSDVGGNPFPG